jgi:branched-chain amino acid transport system substrate-binding protein
MKTLASVCVAVLFVVGSSIAVAAAPTGGDPSTIRVGALLDLSGEGKTLGLASEAALEVAAESIEEESDGAITVELDIRDTGLDPATASTELQSMLDAGIRLIVGPQSSAEVRAIIDQANAAGAVLISQGSTASSLALPGDAVFRLVPDDRVEGAASVDLIDDQGQTVVVTAHRNDPGNNGLVDSVSAAVTATGGTVVAGPVYEPSTTDFTDTVAALSASVAQATSAGSGDVAVYLAGFEEVADLLAAAAGDSALAEVPWYGGDGSARGQAIIDDADAAGFAADVDGYPSPLLTLSKTVLRDARRTVNEIEDRSGEEPDAFALAAYDGLQLATAAAEEAGPDASGPALQQAFAGAADGYKGITGVIELNDAGDRATGRYAFWAVCDTDDELDWARVGTWTPPKSTGGQGKIKFTGCPR